VAEIGRVLGGRYRLLAVLGEGGMATIYRAHDEQLGRDVAVKILRPEYGRDGAFVARFRQEAQSAASLAHPNVVNVFDYGTDEAGPFIVMELVEGGDLATLLDEQAPLPPIAAAQIAQQIADGLQAAHERGIVHRDIKPSNVLLATGGRVKVVDFGIARALSEAQLTLPGTTLGSVHYFSPEQAAGEPVTGASDIYALGLVVYEMLTGQRPWRGDTAAAVALARLSSEPPVPSQVRAGIPPALDEIVRTALQREPDRRFRSAAAFSAALGRFIESPNAPVAAILGGAAGGLGAGAYAATTVRDQHPTVVGAALPARRPPPPVAVPPPLPAERGTYTPRRYVEEEEPQGSSAWGWAAALLGLAILLAAGALVFFLLNGGGGTGAVDSPSPSVVQVPELVGLELDDARRVAQEAGLTLSVGGYEFNDEVPENTVTDQDPDAGGQIQAGGVVSVIVASRNPLVPVPDLRGMTEAEAVDAIVRAGLARGTRSEEFDPVVEQGRVIRSDPRAGLEVARGSTVDYVVSLGASPSPTEAPTPTPTPVPTPPPTPTPVPTPTPATVGDYICLPLPVARDEISDDDLKVGQISPPLPPGADENDYVVIDQSPNPGRKRAPGSEVDLRVLLQELSTCPPDVTPQP
jgi:beta-lactam-binding protein with PASTA domain